MVPGIPQVGGPELLILLVIILLLFGAKRFSSMARELGHLVKGAHSTVEDVKSEFIPEEIDEARRAVEDLKSELASGRERDEHRRKT
jgi:TatA/E family protein of Tat protein translocase